MKVIGGCSVLKVNRFIEAAAMCTAEFGIHRIKNDKREQTTVIIYYVTAGSVSSEMIDAFHVLFISASKFVQIKNKRDRRTLSFTIFWVTKKLVPKSIQLQPS